MKKLLTMLFAALMVGALALPVVAAQTGSSKDTTKTTKTHKAKVHKNKNKSKTQAKTGSAQQ